MAEDGKLHQRTTARIDGMSDEERVELARNLAERRSAGLSEPVRRIAATPDTPSHRAAATGKPADTDAITRLTADLRRTHRRLDQIERTSTSSRYQLGEGSAPSGRYARLLSRANRLERQLRALR